MLLNKLKNKIIKKRIDKKNMLLIKNSGYFDEEYYLNNNKDVKEEKIDALKHFYFNGWKEGRNPSQKFDMSLYSQYFGKVKENPILHYLQNKNQYVDFVIPSSKDGTVTDIIKTYRKINSLNAKISNERKKHRINIVFEEFEEKIFFDGKGVPLLLAIKLCNENNYDLRIISSNVDASIFYDFIKFNNLSFKGNIEFFSINYNMYLDISKYDYFLGTSWSSVETILNIPFIKSQIFYLVQDAEFNYYGVGDTYLRAFNTLNNERVTPIVDSKILYDYLVLKGINNVKNNGIYFEPSFSKELLKPSPKTFKNKEKYNLLYFATPSNKQGLFYFSLEVLDKALKKNILNSNEWNIYVLGNTNQQIIFEDGINVTMLKDISFSNYYKLLSDIDLFFCPSYALRPEYELINAALVGSVCLTNNNDNKQNLTQYSKNIIMTNLNLDDALQGMEQAVKLCFDSKLRKYNYQKAITKDIWSNNFKEIIEFMGKIIGD